jgi:hypothetical protein
MNNPIKNWNWYKEYDRQERGKEYPNQFVHVKFYQGDHIEKKIWCSDYFVDRDWIITKTIPI